MTERKPQKPTRSVQGNQKEESEKGRKAWGRPLSTSRIQLLSQRRAEGGHWGSWLTSRRTPAQSLHHGAQRGGPDMPRRARAHPGPSLPPPPSTQLRYTGCFDTDTLHQPLCTVDSQCRQVSPPLAAKSGVDLQVGSAQSSRPASGLREPERAPGTCCGPSNAGGWVRCWGRFLDGFSEPGSRSSPDPNWLDDLRKVTLLTGPQSLDLSSAGQYIIVVILRKWAM